MLHSSMKLRNKKMVLEKDIKDGVLKFMEHLNNTMDKPDGYEYHLNTRGSKYFKVEMTTRGTSRSVYCFIEKATEIRNTSPMHLYICIYIYIFFLLLLM